MIIDEIAATYSRALFYLTASDDVLEKRLSDLEEVLELLKQFPDLRHILVAPQIETKQKGELLKKILGGSIDPVVMNFLFCVLDKGRFNCLPQIVRQYHRMVKSKLGILEIRFITAMEINSGFTDVLKAKLEKMYNTKIQIKEEIDPRIIGGAILVINNQMMDFSLKTRLNRLKNSLLAKKG